ncbi:MAG TPA: hypothetical protein VJ990_09350 [Clostridia bacterium]|nr:hypothetical protein [Clostridia bacterium]
MKITIRNKGRRRFSIRLPFWFFTLFINKTVLRIAMHSAAEDARVWIENMDAGALRKAVHELKSYRGLEIVRVDSVDGTHVRIVL